MDYNYKLENFEGPLDLLLHLIEKHKIDIYDIPIVEITSQYLQYIEEWNKFDIHYSSEFLLMAATLLHIKSRMLLPAKEDPREEEMDPRDELVQRLVDFKRIKELASIVEQKREEGEYFFARPIEVSELGTKSVYDLRHVPLYEIFYEALRRMDEEEEDPVQVVVSKEVYTVEKSSKGILFAIAQKGKLSFREYLRGCTCRDELVNTFLAVLELLKTQLLSLEVKGDNFALTKGRKYDSP